MRTVCIAAGFLLLAGCGEPIPPTAGAPLAGTKQPEGQLTLPAASRQFLSVEPLAPAESSATRTYFGRTAFRPKALSAVTAPFSGRVATVSAEPGQRIRAGATLFTIQSADAGGIRASLDQARIRLRVAEEVLARQTEMVKRGVGLEIERFDAEMKLREARSEVERSERNAALVGSGEGTGELWLPVTAVLLKEGGKRVVYVEEKDGSFSPREIDAGDERGGRVRVLKGLQAGERVVMRGALLVDREAEQLL